ncbi:hypothetical protein CWI84_04310 [Idiomarina tyrosinivorans]|uniref:Uncharacterized protein n=1 Tax=Idiomarina tyrosinivorans TaxID=1445662 RepID=A0A432ZSG1_9GAMM|nr:hypothetical protein CWI84_04310 [Idiomarina tyrosinivorans]
MGKLFSRTVKIGIFLNLPPLLMLLMGFLKLDIFPITFTALLWASIPLQYVGMASFFTESQITFNEWGVSQASPVVWLSIVLFWLLLAALISYISLLRIHRD